MIKEIILTELSLTGMAVTGHIAVMIPSDTKRNLMKGKFTKILGDIILPAGFFMICGFAGEWAEGKPCNNRYML